MDARELLKKLSDNSAVVCVVGLGYVGMHAATGFAKSGLRVLGYDISEERVEALRKGIDWSGEIGKETIDKLVREKKISFHSNPSVIRDADFVVVAVPTLLTSSKQPDLGPVRAASKTVGGNLKRGACVVLESSVYPGVTEEVMLPILEQESGMKAGRDFFVGYSPERVNPGDAEHTLEKIVKVVSGMDEGTADVVAALYSRVVKKGVFKARSIKTAEAAKIIENIQRDINIALLNEFALIFERMGISIWDVLEAAGTKWNFVKFRPGFVGGWCVPVNPYYLVHKAREAGYSPQVMLAGRSTNDHMPIHVAELALRALNEAGKAAKKSSVLVMGLTFKENIREPRASPAKLMIETLRSHGLGVVGFDPNLAPEQIEKEFGIKSISGLGGSEKFDVVIVTVAHEQFKKITLADIQKTMGANPVLVDVRAIYPENEAGRMFKYIRL
ncbi:MAG: nucleotide sugar dehydrogenase [Candidatus Micrarchaeota archaeon]